MNTERTQGEWFAGSLLHWHVDSEDTDGTFTLGEALVRPGGEPPIHVHSREDETFYVLEGEITFLRGHERIAARAGDAVLMPRGVRHGFAVQTESARLLQAFTPGGLERAFRSLSGPSPEDPPPAPEAMMAAFAAEGVEFTGPPLAALLASDERSG
jgi:quercetin dioxygenase-like cupin family protein